MLKFSLLLMVIAGALTLTSCNESSEDDALNSAQACLDAVPASNPTQADACLSFVAGLNSPAANLLKCSIYMTSGGLVDSRILQSYKTLSSATTGDKEAAFLASLTLNLPTVAAGYAKAVEGNQYCQQSGSAGLRFVGSAIVAGTYLNKVINDVTGSGVDVNDPSSIQTAVQNMLNNCTGLTPDAACSSDVGTLGTTTIMLADSYCSSASANQDVCGKVNSAVAAANGNASEVGEALMCYLNQKTYDPVLQRCQ